MATPLRSLRVHTDVWAPALARAREERTTITALVVGWLTEYGQKSAAITEPEAAVRKVPGTAREPKPASAPQAPPAARRCTHPGKRSVGGWCPGCDHLILTGGAWA